MPNFQDVKKAFKLRSEAKEIQKKLKNIHVEADEGNVTITINCEQTVMKVDIKDETMSPDTKRKLENNLVVAFNKAIKKAQSIAAENMKGIMSQLSGNLGE